MESSTKPLTYEEIVALIKNKEISDRTVKSAVWASHRSSLLSTKTQEVTDLIKEHRNNLYWLMWMDAVLYSI